MTDLLVANRLAALATALDDAVHAETEDLSPSAVAALQTIRQEGPMAIQDVARVVGLTHSATVRLIDRLEKDWLVRRLTRKGREVRVETTARGRRRAGQFQERRLAAASHLLAVLSPEEREVFALALDRMLAAAVVDPTSGERICRDCDRDACRGEGCPVAAAAERLATSPASA